MSLTPDIERVLSEHRGVQRKPLPRNNADHNLGRTRYGMFCTCGAEMPWECSDERHEAHRAEQIGALVEQAEGDHLAAFLAQLPGDLFSETEIQRVREWAGEWLG